MKFTLQIKYLCDIKDTIGDLKKTFSNFQEMENWLKNKLFTKIFTFLLKKNC